MFTTSLDGDFYPESDDVVRGLTFTFRDDICLDTDNESGNGKIATQEGSPASPYLIRRFLAIDIAPVLSGEIASNFVATVLRLDQRSPITVGNHVLKFFEQVVSARMQVNHKKFTMRAETSSQGYHCDVKVRLYQNESGCVVEFQRRSGDIVAFNRLYRQVAVYLQTLSDLQETCTSAVEDKCLIDLSESVISQPPHRLAPLLDLVESHPNLFAEVTAALVVMAKDPLVEAELRMPCALSTMQQLGKSNEINFALPPPCAA
jgi:hypothetical protein